MVDLQTEFNSCLYHASSALHRWLTKKADHHFKAVKLTPTEGFVLMTLRLAPGISITDLGSVHQLDPTTITKVVKRLGDQKLAQKERFGNVIRVFLTPAGEQKEADAKAAWQKLQIDYKQLIGENKAARIAKDVTGALHALDGH